MKHIKLFEEYSTEEQVNESLFVASLILSGIGILGGVYKMYKTKKRLEEIIDNEKDPKKKEKLKKELNIIKEKEVYYKSEYLRKKKEFDEKKKNLTTEEKTELIKKLKELEKKAKEKQKWWEGVPIWKL